jgi:pimeloyl-ACP methyl ester carboxylesterase
LQNAKALKSLLEASNENGPFIIAGHSVGGQMVQQFAALYPSLTSGLVMLDSYNDAAIALQWMGAKNVTFTRADGTTVTRPDLAMMYNFPLGATDAMRALTPLAWARFITLKPEDGSYWKGAMNAAYGNNKEWHSQFVELYSAAKGYSPPLADRLTELAGRVSFWQGVSWPSLGSKPVLLLPAAATLALPVGCDKDFETNASCQADILGRSTAFYPKLYLAYKDTMSTNTTLTVLVGSHAVWDQADLVSNYILQKFAGV